MMPVVLWPDGSTNVPRATSEFNPARRNPVTGIFQPHDGIDLVGWSVIVAPAAGIVTFAGYNGGAGNEVRVRADGPNAFIKGDVYRMLHNRELWVRTGTRVAQGQGVAVMGTTGNSTGVHCHFETRPGGGAAINPRQYMASRNASTAGGGSTPTQSEEDEMNADQNMKLDAVFSALFGPASVGAKQLNWAEVDGSTGSAQYGLLPIVIRNQVIVAQNQGKIDALAAAVAQLSAGSGVALDMKAIEAAADRGARKALEGLVLTAKS